jgi:hypothetical protein
MDAADPYCLSRIGDLAQHTAIVLEPLEVAWSRMT